MKKLHVEMFEGAKEVTEEKYEYMLGVVPPDQMATNGFTVGEPYDHRNGAPRFELYFQKDGKYYTAGLATRSEFDMMLIPNE